MTDLINPSDEITTGEDPIAAVEPDRAPGAEASPDSAAEDAISPQADPALTTHEPQPTPEAAPAKRSIVRRLLRFTFLLVALAGVVAAVIYVAPIINDRIIQPVETNTADTAALQASVEESGARIDVLETEAAALRADLGIVSEAAASNTTRLDDIDTLIADQTARLDDLDELAATLGTEIDAAASATGLEIDFLKSTELLSRARLFLYQANYGLAAQDVQGARDILARLQASQGSDGPVDNSILADALTRIDLVLAALPSRPVAASDDLDIAWRLLLDEPLSPLVASPTAPVAPPTDPAEVDPTTPQG